MQGITSITIACAGSVFREHQAARPPSPSLPTPRSD